MNRGRFITFEGGEGTGKSTQVRLLAEALRSLCVDVHVSREPGGSEGAEKIRPLLVSGDYAWDVHAEYLLFSAARSDHLAKVIRPELGPARGSFVTVFMIHPMSIRGLRRASTKHL